VTVNDPAAAGGSFDFATLDVADVERIEVLRGPQSTLWGSAAIGGVVNIITRRADPGLSVSGFAEAGSFATRRGGAALGYGGERGDIRLSATAAASDGFSAAAESLGNDEKDGFETMTLSAAGGLDVGEGARLTGSIRFIDQENDFDAFGGAGGDAPNTGDSQELLASGGFSFGAFDGRLGNSLTAGYAGIDRTSRSSFGDTTFDGQRLFARYQGDLRVTEANRVAFGVESEATEAGGSGVGPDSDDTINSVFGLWETRPLDGLTLTLGLRRDETGDFGGETTARLAAAYRATEALVLRGSAGQGFRAPSLFQRVYGNPVANADLEPETSDGFDLGFDLALFGGRSGVGATYFNQKIENQIDYFSEGVFGTPSFRDGYRNLDETEYEGVELTGFVDLTDALRLTGAYAYTDARDAITGERLGRRPYNAATAELFWDAGGPFTASVLAIYNGEEIERDFVGNQTATVDDWVRVDLSLAHDLVEGVALYGRLENLFDEDYEVIDGYGAAGRSAFVGLRASF
jgi:vitamin B12 transporter